MYALDGRGMMWVGVLEMLSKYNREVIEHIFGLDGKCMPENDVPLWIDVRRIEHMCNEGLLICVTLIPPGREGYEHGLSGYVVSPAGVDALEELLAFEEQLKKLKADQDAQVKANEIQRKQDRRQSFLSDVVVMLLSLGIPCFVDHFDAFVEFIHKAFRWITALMK